MELLIPKKTATYADALCAIGYASLLAELREESVEIKDLGGAYRISCPDGIEVSDWQPPHAGFRYIWRRTQELGQPPGDPTKVLDYESEASIAEALKKASASAKAKQKVEEAIEEVMDAQTVSNSPDFSFARTLETFFKRSGDPTASKPIGWQTDRKLFRWVIENPQEVLVSLRKKLQGDVVSLSFECTSSQFINPSTGKGVHAAKTKAKSASSFTLLDSFDEWAKLRGVWSSMLAFRSGDDYKFFVIDPGEIPFADIQKLRTELCKRNMWGIVRLDIEAVLRLLHTLVLHSDAIEEDGFPLLDLMPSQVIRGFQMAFFKNLGQSAALMNDSLLPLPSWFAIENREDANAYLRICEEPYGKGTGTKGDVGPLTALNEKHSDDIELLQKYRRWLTSGELADLLEFHASFAPWLLRKQAASEFAPAFRVSILHQLLSKGYPEVKEIIESPGFRSIADAIRNTTVRAVWEKQKDRQQPREIRFGLAQRIKQSTKAGPKAFIAEVSDFIQKQNWEVATKYEGRRHSVSETDLDQLVTLTSKHGEKLVGMLLLAYGFARAEAVGNKEESEAQEAVTA